MVSFCCKLTSYLPSLNRTNVNRLIIGAGGLATYCFAGPVAAAFTVFAACLYSRNLSKPLQRRVVPLPQEVRGIKECKQSLMGRKLDPSVYFLEPSGKAADIRNHGNSCAFSSVLWNLANTREILAELPSAILRRLNEISSLRENIVETAAIRRILSKQDSINLKDFQELKIALANLEEFLVDPSIKELLSLLELHQLIREFQGAEQMNGQRVNALRNMIFRVNPSFEATGVQMGDAHEIFLNLAGLIFRNSVFEQRFHFQNHHGRPSCEPNWGHLELPLKGGISLADSLLEYFNSCQGQFDKAPPFIVLNLKRHAFTYTESKGGNWVPTLKRLFDPVIPNSRFHLNSDYFRDKVGADYELAGVARRLEGRAHYDAIWKRPDGQWYYGDDLDKVSKAKPPTDPSGKASQVASQGYLYFYRKITD